MVDILESFGALDKLDGFACKNGRAFYNIPQPTNLKMVELKKSEMVVPKEIPYTDDNGESACVVPFLAGKPLNYSL